MAVLKTHRQNKKINMPSLKWCVCRKLKKRNTQISFRFVLPQILRNILCEFSLFELNPR